MDTKLILQSFVESLNDALSTWSSTAGKFYMNSSAKAFVWNFIKLRYVNERIDWFRKELKDHNDYYKELIKKNNLKILSLAYLEEFSISTKNLISTIDEIKKIGENYYIILSKCELNGRDTRMSYIINKYVNPKNIKAIERLKFMDLENLIDILNDNELLGF